MQTWKPCFQCDFFGQVLCSGGAPSGNRRGGDRFSGFWAELEEVKAIHPTSPFSQNVICFSKGRNPHQLHCLEFHQNCRGRNYSCTSVKQSLNSKHSKDTQEETSGSYYVCLHGASSAVTRMFVCDRNYLWGTLSFWTEDLSEWVTWCKSESSGGEADYGHV